jgi:hypothetical protein
MSFEVFLLLNTDCQYSASLFACNPTTQRRLAKRDAIGIFDFSGAQLLADAEQRFD